MNKQQLFKQIQKKQSYLCVGLDTDPTKIPSHLLKEKDPVFEFNKQIIDATAEHCVAYKPNLAFYESQGLKGWESLQKTLEYIPKDIFTIADAKRGDIGNTAAMYAKAFFEQMAFDSITVAPYMGEDSVKPFVGFKDKWVILLGLTSNPGSQNFQMQKLESGEFVYERVILEAQKWGTPDQLMFVIGATQGSAFENIRRIAPDNFLLVPGIGAQGGDLEAVSRYGMNKECGLLVNASRSIQYASSGKDFGQAAGAAALQMRNEMVSYLEKYI
jgi:orotidine-5'-phosphate decarboxylase